jgi:hypothetical protein
MVPRLPSYELGLEFMKKPAPEKLLVCRRLTFGSLTELKFV